MAPAFPSMNCFARSRQRQPDAIALADAPNRAMFTDGAPRRLTFARPTAWSRRSPAGCRRMGLPIDTIVGIQLPNIVENVLTILGVLRAGMIAAPMPLLWRSADVIAAMARVGAKALITCGRVGSFEHCRLATRVAADVFSIRYVCGFGGNLSDGVVPLARSVHGGEARPDPAARPRRQCGGTSRRRSISRSAKTDRCRSRAAISNCWRAACASCPKAASRPTAASSRPSRRRRLPA